MLNQPSREGLSNERIKTIVRSRGESILQSQTIELSVEEESAIFSAKERSPSTANGPPLRCSRCNRLEHAANKCTDFSLYPLASVKAVLSCFNCGREGHVARNCRWRPTHKDGIGRHTQYEGSVSRDAQPRGGVGRDTEKLSRAQGKGWIRPGKDGRELSSNPTTRRKQVNGGSQFVINECEKHCKSRLDIVTAGVDLGRTEKLKFLIHTGAEISVVRGTRLRPGFNYDPTKGINIKGISKVLLRTEGTVLLKLFT